MIIVEYAAQRRNQFMKLHNAETQILSNDKQIIRDKWEIINTLQSDTKALSDRLNETGILGVTEKIDLILQILEGYRKDLSRKYGEICIREDI